MLVQTGFDQRLLEQRAGIGQLQILAVVIDMPDISQGKDRLTAIAFAAGDGGNRPGGGDGGLGSVADAGCCGYRPRSPANPARGGPNRAR